MRRTSLVFPVFGLALLAAGCGHGSVSPRGALLSDDPARPPAGCRVSSVPASLPAADRLVDSAALLRDVAALAAGSDAPTGHALFAIRHDAEGNNVRRDLLERSVPAAVADSVQRLVFAHRRRAEPAPREWAVRLRVELAGAPSVAVGRMLRCEPRPRHEGWGAGVTAPPAGLRLALPEEPWAGAPLAVRVRVTVDEWGQVVDARVVRTAGPRILEGDVLSYAHSLPFHPATEDGLPVRGEAFVELRAER